MNIDPVDYQIYSYQSSIQLFPMKSRLFYCLGVYGAANSLACDNRNRGGS